MATREWVGMEGSPTQKVYMRQVADASPLLAEALPWVKECISISSAHVDCILSIHLSRLACLLHYSDYLYLLP